MFGFGPATRIYLAPGATDMRKNFNGLYGLVRDHLGCDPESGHVFLFAHARRNRIFADFAHTLLALHGNILTFIRIADGKVHDVNILDEILPEAGSFYVMDRGYIDFERLHAFTLSSAFFVVRSKKNVLLQRRYSHPVDKSTGVRSDLTVILAKLPDRSRRIRTPCAA